MCVLLSSYWIGPLRSWRRQACHLPALDMSNAAFWKVQTVYFMLHLAIAWAVMPLWAFSTWRHRRSLYVRVRQPVWLLVDIALTLIVITLISVKEMLMERGQDLPCILTDVAAAASTVWLPGVMLCRSLRLWYASIIFDVRVDRMFLLRRFRLCLVGGLLFIALSGGTLAAKRGHFCLSNICQVQCYWWTQYFLLVPLGSLLVALSALAWKASLSVQGIERLGLRTEFRRLNMLAVPMIVMSTVLNISMDRGVVSPLPIGHVMASACWLLSYTARFIALHVLPSINYGYYPRNPFRRCTAHKIAPAQKGTLQALLLPPQGADRSPEAEQQEIAYNHGLQTPSAPPQADLSGGVLVDREAAAYEMAPVALTDSGSLANLDIHASLFYTASRLSSPAASESTTSSHSSRTSSPGSEPRVFLPRLMASVPVSSMSLQDMLDSGDNRLLGELLFICRTLCCDHWVLFLVALHPHLESLGHQGGVSRPVPRGVVASIYTLFLCPGAPLLAPVYGPLLELIREYCRPRFRHQQADILTRLSSIHQRSDSQPLPSRLERFLVRLRLLGLEDQGPIDEGEECAATSITELLHLAYCTVREVVSEEVVPLFKAYMETRGLEEDKRGQDTSYSTARPSAISAASAEASGNSYTKALGEGKRLLSSSLKEIFMKSRTTLPTGSESSVHAKAEGDGHDIAYTA